MDEYQKVKEYFELQSKRLRQLRNGEDVLCLKCKVGYMRPIGDDYKRASTYIRNHCRNQLILN